MQRDLASMLQQKNHLAALVLGVAGGLAGIAILVTQL
mgnify:CR=1 FL=1